MAGGYQRYYRSGAILPLGASAVLSLRTAVLSLRTAVLPLGRDKAYSGEERQLQRGGRKDDGCDKDVYV